MNETKLLEAAKLTSPNPLSLVCALKEDGKTNLATISWWTYLSVEPPRIGFAMMKTSYSGERIRYTKEAILTIPGEALVKAVMGCGSSSGRNTDKIEEYGIEMMKLPGEAISIPAASVAAFVCELKEFVDVGDHYFHVCTIRRVYENVEENPLFAWKGYLKIAPAEVGQIRR